MKKFKVNNQVHEIDEGFEHLLPVGAVEITQAEAEALLAPTSEEINSARIQAIKNEAQIRIIAHLPSGSPDNFIIKQMNLMMLNAELDDIVIKGGTLTTEQAAMKASFIQLKDKIKAIRDMSNIAEDSGHTIDKFKSDLDLTGL